MINIVKKCDRYFLNDGSERVKQATLPNDFYRHINNALFLTHLQIYMIEFITGVKNSQD